MLPPAVVAAAGLALCVALARSALGLLAFPRGASFGYLAAVAMPLDLPNRNVYVSFNFESNYGLPPNDSYNQWIQRWNLNGSFLGIGNDVTPINGRQQQEPEAQQRLERSTGGYTRHAFYRTVVGFLQHYGFNGSACLLRCICDVSAARLDEGNGLLGSIFNVLFIPFASAPESQHDAHFPGSYEAATWGAAGAQHCQRYRLGCPRGLLDMISEFH